MGNQLSTEVKGESDGIDGNLNRLPIHPSYLHSQADGSPPSSALPDPDIVYSSQVPTSTDRNPPFRLKPRHFKLEKLDEADDIPSSPPRLQPTMSSTRQGFNFEVPESPQASVPGHQSTKKKRRPSHTLVNPPFSIAMRDSSSLNGTPQIHGGTLREGHQKRRKSKKSKARHVSPDLGNHEISSDAAEVAANQQDSPTLYPANGAAIQSTPSDTSLSRKRKAASTSSRSKKKSKHKHNHDQDDTTDPTASFSGLAEQLYAGRERNEQSLDVDEDCLMQNNSQEQSPPDSRRERSSLDSPISVSNMKAGDTDTDQAAHSDEASNDEMEIESTRGLSSSNEGQRNDPVASSGDNDSSNNAPSVNHSQTASDQNQNDDEAEESGGNEDNGEAGSVRTTSPAPSVASPSGNTANEEYRPDDEEDVQDDLEYDHASIASRPKQGSARKRFVKPSFFERTKEGKADVSTPSNNRRASSSAVAGLSYPTGARKAKISTMLKGNMEDSPQPKASKSKQRAIPRQRSQPHELVTGQFSDFELRNITQAVERWRDDNDLTQTQVNEIIHGDPREGRSHEFWARIVATCPNRRRQKVINQCRRKFHNFVARGTWTPEQQEELKELWEYHGNKYAYIGKLINRHPEDVRDRVRNYVVCGESRRVNPWSQEEEGKLQLIIAEALQVIRDRREEGKLASSEPDEDLIDWQRVSELMDRTRSRLQCMQKWKLMNRQRQDGNGGVDGGEALTADQIIQNARDEAAAMSSRDRYNILKAVRVYNTSADSRIPWAKVRTKQLRDQWSRPTLMLVWYRMKHSVPDSHMMTVSEIINQLSARYHETRELEYPSGEDYDLDAEYRDLENKVNKILKSYRPPKSSRIVVKTDDEDEITEGSEKSSENQEHPHDGLENSDDEETGGDEDIDTSNEEEVVNEDNGKDDQESGRHDVDDEEGSQADRDSSEDVSMEDGPNHESDSSSDLSHNGGNSREPSSGAPSISDFKPQTVQRGQKHYGSSSRVIRPGNPTSNTARKTPKIIDESSEDEEGSDGEPSSDTNASEASSIPAHL
ncbi:hypothetical protein F4677DRAFT_433606 [Hypoxylon crocopeplum]|nr:hypothetical protein F4677DRAFT_433606 [Hypoxylon crocopeplum]